MIKYTYDHELITMTNQFLNTMSDIVINRFNVHKQARDRIKTRIVYAPKQRVLNDLLDRDQNLQLPVMAVQISGVTRDETRVTNKILGSFYNLNSKSYSFHEKTPLPVDVRYTVSILTRYQEDLDQILTHLTPYVNPYLVVSWRTPKRRHHEIRSKVLWDGSINTQYPVDLASTTVARVVADLSFVFKGWLFQDVQDPVGNIHYIQTNNFTGMFANSSEIDEQYLLVDPHAVDRVSYSALPQPNLTEPQTLRIGEQKLINVFGTGFTLVKNVYVSGCPYADQSVLHSPFEHDINLSTQFSPFYGVKVPLADWSSATDSVLTINMPQATSAGTVDIIVENQAGYGKLSQCIRLELTNDFNSVTSANYTTVPCQSGIKVVLANGSTPFLVDEYVLLNGSGGFDYLLQENGDKIILNPPAC